ncbi:MAG: nucleotidyltransferase family protein [Candidatus Bathyarchaeota archaeon]|nr:nucleotidyltransferase family protein [Candidatus Bathyarchaeota archaeon]
MNSLSLVKAIGLPGIIESKAPLPSEYLNLFHLAKLNKIPLLYLESHRFEGNPFLEAQLLLFKRRYEQTLELTAHTATLFDKYGIRYVLFKTLKPFPYVPSDIDILLLSKSDLRKAFVVLKERQCKVLDKDIYGMTIESPMYQINLDLTTEIAVSGLVYIDKTQLYKSISQVKVKDVEVQTLAPHVDMVVSAAHSMYKEQMYLLSDYYTLALSLKYFKEALDFARNVCVQYALETSLKMTYDIILNAFGSSDFSPEESVKSLSVYKYKSAAWNQIFEFPAKYPINIIQRALLEKILKDNSTKESFLNSFETMLRPSTIRKLISHIHRKVY